MTNNKEKSSAKNELLLHLFYIIMFGILLMVLSAFSVPYHKSTTPIPQQASPPILLKTIPIQSTYFATDKLQQFYTLNPDNELIKYDANGNELFRYSENRFGTLGHLDATNPFQVLLYYPDFLMVVTLDRTLNPLHTISLSNLNLVQTQAIGISTDNNVWLYDDVSFRVKKINQRTETLTQSNDLSLELGTTLQPNFLVERNNLVFLNNPTTGIIVFDVFGQFSKQLDIQGLTHFQILEHQLFYQKANQLLVFDLKALTTQPFALPKTSEKTDRFFVQKNRLYVVKSEVVEIYRI